MNIPIVPPSPSPDPSSDYSSSSRMTPLSGSGGSVGSVPLTPTIQKPTMNANDIPIHAVSPVSASDGDSASDSDLDSEVPEIGGLGLSHAPARTSEADIARAAAAGIIQRPSFVQSPDIDDAADNIERLRDQGQGLDGDFEDDMNSNSIGMMKLVPIPGLSTQSTEEPSPNVDPVDGESEVDEAHGSFLPPVSGINDAPAPVSRFEFGQRQRQLENEAEESGEVEKEDGGLLPPISFSIFRVNETDGTTAEAGVAETKMNMANGRGDEGEGEGESSSSSSTVSESSSVSSSSSSPEPGPRAMLLDSGSTMAMKSSLIKSLLDAVPDELPDPMQRLDEDEDDGEHEPAPMSTREQFVGYEEPVVPVTREAFSPIADTQADGEAAGGNVGTVVDSAAPVPRRLPPLGSSSGVDGDSGGSGGPSFVIVDDEIPIPAGPAGAELDPGSESGSGSELEEAMGEECVTDIGDAGGEQPRISKASSGALRGGEGDEGEGGGGSEGGVDSAAVVSGAGIAAVRPHTPPRFSPVPRSFMRSKSRTMAFSRSQYVNERSVDVFGETTIQLLSDKSKNLVGFGLAFQGDEKMAGAYSMWSARTYGRRWSTVSAYLAVLLMVGIGALDWWAHSLSFTAQFYADFTGDGLYLMLMLVSCFFFLLVGIILNVFKSALRSRQIWLFVAWFFAMAIVPAGEVIIRQNNNLSVEFPLLLLPLIWFMSIVPRMKARLVFVLGLVCCISYAAFAILYLKPSLLNLTLAVHEVGLLFAILVGMMFALALEQAARNRFTGWYTLRKAYQHLSVGKKEADKYLSAIVPAKMRSVFKSNPSPLSVLLNDVGVLVVSVSDFESNFCERTGYSAEEATALLRTLFERFSQIVDELKLEKIAIFANTYIVAANIAGNVGMQEDANMALARLALLLHLEANTVATEERDRRVALNEEKLKSKSKSKSKSRKKRKGEGEGEREVDGDGEKEESGMENDTLAANLAQITLTLRTCIDIGTIARTFAGEVIAGQFRYAAWGDPFHYLFALDRMCIPGSSIITPRFKTALEGSRNWSDTEFVMKEADLVRIPSINKSIKPYWLSAADTVPMIRDRAISERRDVHRGSMQRLLDRDHIGSSSGTGLMSTRADGSSTSVSVSTSSLPQAVSNASLPSLPSPQLPRRESRNSVAVNPRIEELRGSTQFSSSSAAIARRDSNAAKRQQEELEALSRGNAFCGCCSSRNNDSQTMSSKAERKVKEKEEAEKAKKRKEQTVAELLLHTKHAAADIKGSLNPITLRVKNDEDDVNVVDVEESEAWEFVMEKQGSLIRRLSIVALVFSIVFSAPEVFLGWSSWTNLFTMDFIFMAGARAAWVVFSLFWVIITGLYRCCRKTATAPHWIVSAVFLLLLGLISIVPARFGIPGGLLVSQAPTLVPWSAALDGELVIGLCGIVMAVVVTRCSFILTALVLLIPIAAYPLSYLYPATLMLTLNIVRIIPPLALIWILAVTGVYGIERDQRLSFVGHNRVRDMRPLLRRSQEQCRRYMLCLVPADPAVRWLESGSAPIDQVEYGGVLCVRLGGISELISVVGLDKALPLINSAFMQLESIGESRDLVKSVVFSDTIIFTTPSTGSYHSLQFWLSRLCSAAIDMSDNLTLSMDSDSTYSNAKFQLSAAIASGQFISASFDEFHWNCFGSAVNEARWLELMGEPGVILLSEKAGVSMTPYFEMEKYDSKSRSVLSDAELRSAFDSLDHDRNGNLEASELASAMSHFGRHMSMEEAQTVIDEADVDGDNFMQFDEFCAFIRAQGGAGCDLRDAMRLDADEKIFVLKKEIEDAPELYLPDNEMEQFENRWVQPVQNKRVKNIRAV